MSDERQKRWRVVGCLDLDGSYIEGPDGREFGTDHARDEQEQIAAALNACSGAPDPRLGELVQARRVWQGLVNIVSCTSPDGSVELGQVEHAYERAEAAESRARQAEAQLAEAERVADGYLRNAAGDCAACAEVVCCGSATVPHSGCVVAEADQLRHEVENLRIQLNSRGD